MLNRTILILFFVLLTSACSVTNAADVTSSPGGAITVLQTATHDFKNSTAAPLPANTQIPPTRTQTVPPNTPPETSTSTETPIPGTTKTCLEVLPEVSLSSLSNKGWAVYKESVNSPLKFVDLSTGNQHEFPQQLLSDSGRPFALAFSPNRKYLAIEESKANEEGYVVERHFWVINAEGSIISDFDSALSWSGFRWVNNEQLEISHVAEEQPWPFNIIIFNPLTGQREDFQTSDPDITYYPDQRPGRTDSFSPNLKQVFYLNADEDGYRNKVVLWNLVEGIPIWQKDGILSLSRFDPVWAPNSEQVALIVEDQLYRISHTGQEIPIPLLVEDVTIYNFSWSPDGQRIALWAKFIQESISRLFILETATNTIVDYCLEIYPNGRIPIWSPNGRNVITRILYEHEDGSTEYITIIINLENETVHQILDNETPLGWMVAPQESE